MQAFIVPTTFTASDRYSRTLDHMNARTRGFAGGLHQVSTTSDRLFSRMTPHLNEVSKQILQAAGVAQIAAKIVQGAEWSVDQLMSYEDELANLQAVTGASGKDFDTFKTNINEVAAETKKSSVVVAQAFTAIANNQPELLKDADALAMVVKQSILLAKAAKIDLQPAGEAVTQVLNQYGKGADYAAKLVATLAAGSVAGSSEIRDTAEAIKQFGTVAAVAGVKIEESVALIELGSKFDKGAEAGVKFRNILLNMTGAKVLDKLALKDLKVAGVNLDIVSSKTLPLNTRLMEMSKIANNTNAIMHVFGKENAAMAAGVLTNAGSFAKMEEQVSKTGEAERMMEKNSDTLRNRIEEAQGAFVTYLTSSDNLSSGLNDAKEVLKYVANNIDGIVSAGINLLKFMALWKGANLVMKASTMALSAVNTAFYIVDMVKYVASTQGITFATAAWQIVQESLNATILANPIGIVIAGAIALAAAVYGIKRAVDAANVSQSVSNQVHERASDLAADQIADAKILFQALRQNAKGTQEFSDAERKLKELSPDLVAGYDAQKMSLEQLNNMEKLLTSSIMKRAEQEARAELLKEKTKELIKSQLTGPSAMDYVMAAASGQTAGNYANINNEIKKSEINQLSNDIYKNQETKPAVNTKVAQAESMVDINSTNKSEATLRIVNESNNGATIESGNKSSGILPKTTSTVKMQ